MGDHLAIRPKAVAADWARRLVIGLALCVAHPATAQTLVAAVSPTARSVSVGQTATAYATIINTGTVTGTSCGITPLTSIPATFFYQTTDGATNALTGTINTPVNIPAGASQSFAFGFTPSSPFSNIAVMSFKCANTSAAVNTTALNVLTLTASNTPVADIIAGAATASNDGVARVASATGTGFFAVAAVNIGAAETITLRPSSGDLATLPLAMTICETNPASGACLAPPADFVTTAFAPNIVRTFSVFLAGQGTVVTPDFFAKRVRLVIFNGSGENRGGTSVAVCTVGAPNCTSPPTMSLVATPSTIIPSATSVLSWTSANTTGCTAFGGWSGARGTSGSVTTAALSTTTTFSLTCTGAGGSVAANATVNVVAPQAPTVTLIANPTGVTPGGTSLLTWATTDATSCTASGGWSGTKAIAGAETTGALGASTTYTLSCSGPGGNGSGSATVNVGSSTVLLVANPTSAATGSKVQLSWSGLGISGCTALGGWNGAKATSGSEASPAITGSRAFTLTCSGSGGPVSSTVQVADIPLDNQAATVSYLELLPNRMLAPNDTGLIDVRLTDTVVSDRVEIVPITGAVIPLTGSDGRHWAAQVDAGILLRPYVAGRSQVFSGFLDTYRNGVRLARRNLVLPVRSSAMPDVDLQVVNSDIQTSTHVINIRSDTNYQGSFRAAWPQLEGIVVNAIGARDFYALLGPVEAYDNRTGGTSLLSFPLSTFADLADSGASHEIGHLWLARTNHPLVKGLNNSPHWAVGEAAYGIMGSNYTTAEGLQFPFTMEPGTSNGTAVTILRDAPRANEFNNLELYKMGLIPASQVAPIRQFTDPSQAASLLTFSTLPSCGTGCTIVSTPSTLVSIDDIIAADGPTAPATKTSFRLAMVVVSRNRLLNAREMAYFNWLAARGEGTTTVEVAQGLGAPFQSKPFTAATRGLMTLTTRIR